MSATMRLVHVLFVLLAIIDPLAAQDHLSLTAALEEEVPELMEQWHVPAVSMVLIGENRITLTLSFGVRIAGQPEQVDAETVFEAASMSKPLFTYAALKLVERGLLDLDRPLDNYLCEPYLPDEPLAGTITARLVMLHRTGLPNWREGGWRSRKPLTLTKPPDTAFTYSGEGYLYLQRAVEQLTGQELNPWMKECLMAPLGMTRSSYQWRDDFLSNYAGGHDQQGKFKTDRRFYEQANAAYSLYTTPTDYARLLIEMMRPDRTAEHSLNVDTIQSMTTLQVEPEPGDPRSRRALGWVVDSVEDGGWVNHSGSNGSGFQCHARFHMQRKAGSVIMTNSAAGRNVWEAILTIIDTKATAK